MASVESRVFVFIPCQHEFHGEWVQDPKKIFSSTSKTLIHTFYYRFCIMQLVPLNCSWKLSELDVHTYKNISIDVPTYLWIHNSIFFYVIWIFFFDESCCLLKIYNIFFDEMKSMNINRRVGTLGYWLKFEFLVVNTLWVDKWKMWTP